MSTPVITSFARTPIGRYGGALASLRAVELGGVAMRAALDRAGLDPAAVDEVIAGQVLQAGEGQITARQAAVRAGVPMTVPSMTVNKVCLSGTAAIALAAQSIRAGDSTFVLAAGMESMSNAPHVVREVRWGARIGDVTMIDVMHHDGLTCAFDQCSMGESTDHRNRALGIGREEQDEWAARSHRLAAAAAADGRLAEEIVGVETSPPRGDPVVVEADEGIRPGTTRDALARLAPAFVPDGTVTPGNASQISDGAGAVVVADKAAAEAAGLPILAEVVAYGQIGGGDPTLHERPAEAIRVAIKKAGIEAGDLSVVEINEAFASVALWSTRMLGIDPEVVNPRGGAVALGHPLGATGVRLVGTAIMELRTRGGGYAVAAACGGGGQGDALVVKVAA